MKITNIIKKEFDTVLDFYNEITNSSLKNKIIFKYTYSTFNNKLRFNNFTDLEKKQITLFLNKQHAKNEEIISTLMNNNIGNIALLPGFNKKTDYKDIDFRMELKINQNQIETVKKIIKEYKRNNKKRLTINIIIPLFIDEFVKNDDYSVLYSVGIYKTSDIIKILEQYMDIADVYIPYK